MAKRSRVASAIWRLNDETLRGHHEHKNLLFVSLLLVALGLAPGAAHVLEMPVKLGYTPEQYFEVTNTLYAFFGSIGSVVQIGALVAAGVLAFVSRSHPFKGCSSQAWSH